MRILKTELLPKVIAELRGLLVGAGAVEVRSADAFDTRVECQFALRHDLAGMSVVSVLHLMYETRDGWTFVSFDMFGNGQGKLIDPAHPFRFEWNPLTGAEWTMRSEPLTRAMAALKTLPRDDRTEAEYADYSRRLDAAVEPLLGDWVDGADPSRRYTVRRTPDPRGHGRSVVVTAADGRFWLLPVPWYRLEPDGRLPKIAIFDLGHCQPTPNGLRLDFPVTGAYWTRIPKTD